MKQISKYWKSLVVLLSLVGLVFFICIYKSDKIAFVSISRVFSESKISKKFEKDLKEIENASNAKLEVIQKEIRQFKAEGTNLEYIKQLEADLLKMRDQLSQDYQEKNKKFEAVIWGEINKEIESFGKKNGYTLVFGAKGDGTIMYADEAIDITDDIILYLNSK